MLNRPFLIALLTVCVVTLLRAAAAASLPLTGDEAYYWEWSRRLALGYVDHPPAVAFAVAAFSFLGAVPFDVRIPFILCGAAAAIFAGAAAFELSRDARSGALATVAVIVAPLSSVTFFITSPDGPYALAWSAAMYFAVRAFATNRAFWFVLLGAAIGATMLSRIFGIALFLGILVAGLYQPDVRTRRLIWLSTGVALAVFSPFLVWNATHDWVSFVFAMSGRHAGHWNALRPVTTYVVAAIAFLPVLGFVPRRAWLSPTYTPFVFTAYPMIVLMLLLAVHEPVEAYWFLGPFISLAVLIAASRPRMLPLALIPAGVLTAMALVTAFAPRSDYLASFAARHLSDGGPFELFTYPQLARDVKRVAASRDAAVLTDGYGLSSLLDFYAGVKPVLIGPNAEGREALSWTTSLFPQHAALFVDKIPLSHRPDVAHRLHNACLHVSPGPTLVYPIIAHAAAGTRRYYTTWCNGVEPNGLAVLRSP